MFGNLWWDYNARWNFHDILEFLPPLYIIAIKHPFDVLRRAQFALDWNKFYCSYAVWIVWWFV